MSHVKQMSRKELEKFLASWNGKDSTFWFEQIMYTEADIDTAQYLLEAKVKEYEEWKAEQVDWDDTEEKERAEATYDASYEPTANLREPCPYWH